MKKNLMKILSVLSFFLLFSCQDHENESIINEESSPKLVHIDDKGNIFSLKDLNGDELNTSSLSIQFNSFEQFNDMLSKLEGMSKEERDRYIAKIGLISLNNLLELADKELEEIGNSSFDDNDFTTRYAKYRQKYEDIFTFNKIVNDDFSPYMPAASNDLYSYIVGANKAIVVGDQVYKLDFYDEMTETDKAIFAASNIPEYKDLETLTRATSDENGFIVVVGSKKTIYTLKLKSRNVTYNGKTVTYYETWHHFGSQKKMWYGWKRDNDRSFAIKTNGYSLGGFDGAYYSNTGGNMDIKAGDIGKNYNIQGTVYIWTDRTVERNADGSIKFYPGPLNPRRVYCDTKKAYSCRINKVGSF